MVKISLFVTTVLAYLAANADGRAPIDPHVHRMLQQTGTANVFVTMKEKPDTIISAANNKNNKFKSDSDKRTQVSDDLELHAAASQKEVRKLLAGNRQGRFTRFETLWLTNQIFIEGASAELVKELSMLASVAQVEIEESFQMIEPVSTESTPIEQNQTPKPMDEFGAHMNGGFGGSYNNVIQIGAPQAWTSGFNGTGVVVGSIDTGVRYTHSALQASYRGDAYSWYDPTAKTRSPSDGQGQGTHTMGIIVGSGGIGVAPGAKWIACKGCGTSSCSASALLACLQWMYCPTTFDGMTKDCTKAPRVVNNSWGGGQGSTYFASAINTLISGGIVPIFAAGNKGPNCGTVMSPGDLANAIAVGATGTDDHIVWFSSLGPSVNGLLKPDVTAPGAYVRSAYNTNDTAYEIMSGTSMAAPHVTGVVALLFQQDPTATYEMIKSKLLKRSIQTLPENLDTCGGITSDIFPNNIYGYGRVDARRALGLL